MAGKASEVWTSAPLKVGICNAAAGLVGTGAALLLKSSAAPGFAVGFILGGINALLLLKIAGKGVSMPAEKAGRFVTISYIARFTLTAVVVALIIYRGFVEPWPLLAGITASVFTTVGVLIGIARKEASQDA